MSSRARNPRLSLSHGGNLTVVIPSRYDPGRVPEIVERNREWIERARHRLALVAPERTAGTSSRPNAFELRATGERVEIDYVSSERAPRLLESKGRLVLSSPGSSDEELKPLVQRWLSRRARRALEPRLAEMAWRLDVSVNKLAIRAQRTRWASCSASGTISLNRNLLFLPTELVDYVLAHELCHRYELNHSRRFWALLEAAEPESERLRAELRHAWRLVPEWLGS